MPLDKQAQDFLNMMAELGMPPLHDMPIPMQREFMAATDMPGEDIELASIDTFSTPGPGGDLALRLYKPTSEAGLPVLMYYHGGGFVIGDLESHDGLCRALARDVGAAVVAVDYRLAPEHPYPAAIEDCFAALSWIANKGADMGLDTSRLAVAGDSAGGNIAAVMALKARDEGGPNLCHQVLYYAMLDPACDRPSYDLFADGYFLTKAAMQIYWNIYTGAGRTSDPYINPLEAEDLSGVAKATVITADCDPLRDDGLAYAKRLEEAGRLHTVENYDGIFHGFVNHFGIFPQADAALALTAKNLRQTFGFEG